MLLQQAAIRYFLAIENDMVQIESNERETGKTNKVLRILSTSGEKVEELKTIRKKYGAQSEEYKNALTTLDK